MLRIVLMHLEAKPWQCNVFVDLDGEVYMPAGDYGDEMIMALCLIHDCKRQLAYDGHIYAPASWLAQEYPHMASDITAAAQRYRQYLPFSRDAQHADVGHMPPPVAAESMK